MKTDFRNIIVKSSAFLLVGIMVIMVANKAVFTHTHILENGQVISHSHPYDKTNDSEPFKSHHHTQTELIFLQNLETFFPVVFLLLLLIGLLSKANLFIYPSLKFYPVFVLFKTGRSPPVLKIIYYLNTNYRLAKPV